MSTLLAHCGTKKITRDELRGLPVPPATNTYKPISHHEIVDKLIETLSFRHIQVQQDQYAVSPDGMKLFGLLELEYAAIQGLNFAIGIRNANDKSMRLSMTIGYRVFVCDNMAFYGDFTPVLAKHTKHFMLQDALSVGVDRMQRNFDPLQRQITGWQHHLLSDERAKVILYDAFVLQKLHLPMSLFQTVHGQYFKPQHEEFRPRTMWSLANAFTSGIKTLKPMKHFQAATRVHGFLEQYNGGRQGEAINAADEILAGLATQGGPS